MTPFEHISVLISVVIGFAITTLLAGAVRLIHRRDAVIFYWPTELWMITMLLLNVQIWWSRFAWRALQTWTFATFFAMLLVPIGAYALSALLVAEPDERPIDQRKEYFARRQAFFIIGVFTLVASFLPDLLVNGNWGRPLDVALKVTWIILDVLALVTANEIFHKAIAVVTLAMACAYIGLLFATI
jgi:hypothetical protein